jgi:Tfp pilus assembly protein PilF
MTGLFRFVFIIVVFAAQPLQSFAEMAEATLRGTVVLPGGQETGKPVVVELLAAEQAVAVTHTDSGGNFEINVMRPGLYVVRVNEDGFQEAEYPADLSSGSRYIQIHLVKATSVDREKAKAVSGPAVVDLRQLSVPKKALDEYEKALRDIQRAKPQNAIEHLENSLKIAPDFYEARFELGLQYAKTNQPAEAEAEWRRAVELHPRVADPLLGLGLLYLQTRRFNDAIDVLERAIGLNPASARAAYYLGCALTETGDLSGAEKMLKQSLALDPDLHPVRLALVNVYLKEARLKEAFQELEAYLQAEPSGSQSQPATQLRNQLAQQLQIKKSKSD